MSEIFEILCKLNPWWNKKEFETGYMRLDYLNKIKELLESNEILVVNGVRRCGKTTLLMQTIKYLLEEKNVDPKQILFVNFDEADFINLKNPIKSILDIYLQEVCDKKGAYLIFDEIQSVKNWEKWVKVLYDEKEYHLIVSGSSSPILDTQLAKLISGRYLKLNVYPLNFKEYLEFNKLHLSNKLKLVENKNKVIRLLTSYLTNGGFPRIAVEKNEKIKRELLKSYYESIVYKEIILRHEIRSTKVMKELLYYLFSNFTSLYSYKKISELFGSDFSTIKEYLGYIKEAEMIYEISMFSYSLKTQAKNNKKTFCIDNGLRNAVSFKFSKDMGRLAENLVFIELRRREREIYYWNNKNEVDFIVKNSNGSLDAINVTYSDEIKEREIKGLQEFKKQEFKTKKLILITKNLEKKEDSIQYIPLWKWLLK